MTTDKLKQLLEDVARGDTSPEQALGRLKSLPFEDLGFARVDHHRVLRQGFPEVIFGQGKTADQIVAIARAIHAQGAAVLATRVDADTAQAVRAQFPELEYQPA